MEENYDRLMAQFMGHEDFNELKYSVSWDWLMPVIEKIESIVEDSGEFDAKFSNYFISLAHILIRDGDIVFRYNGNANYKNRFEKNYEACVEFIKWYNKINNLQLW